MYTYVGNILISREHSALVNLKVLARSMTRTEEATKYVNSNLQAPRRADSSVWEPRAWHLERIK